MPADAVASKKIQLGVKLKILLLTNIIDIVTHILSMVTAV